MGGRAPREADLNQPETNTETKVQNENVATSQGFPAIREGDMPEEIETKTELPVLTYTAETLFQRCRRLYYWRQVREIVPADADDEPLRIGSLWHGMAEIRDTLRMRGVPRDFATPWAVAWLSRQTTGRAGDPKRRYWWLMLTEAMAAYETAFREGARRLTPNAAHPDQEWPSVEFMGVGDDALRLEGVEHVALAPLINPETGARSKSFRAGLKADVLYRARDDGFLWLGEKKMLSDLGEVLRLWTDYQVARYGRFISRARGERVAGVVYDVVVKPRIRLKEGRTEGVEEWKARVQAKVDEAIAKLRAKEETAEAHAERVRVKIEEEWKKATDKAAEKGKPAPDLSALEKIADKVESLATMQRKIVTPEAIAAEEARVRGLVSMEREIVPPETDDEFRARLREHFAKVENVVRLRIPFTEERLEDAEEIAWESSKQILDAARRDKWRKNLAACYDWKTPCPMVHACSLGLDAETDSRISGYYRREPANPELDDSPMKWVDERIAAGDDPHAIAEAEDRAVETVRDFFSEPIGDTVDFAGDSRKDAENVEF